MNKKSKKMSNLEKLVSQNSNFSFLENGKIKCKITKHEFLPTVQNFQQHLESKSYKKAVEAQFDISQFQQFLQTHKDSDNFLFCKLTGVKLPKKKTAIQKHVKGKRFVKRMEQYKTMNPQESEQQENQIGQVDENEQEEKVQNVKKMKKIKKAGKKQKAQKQHNKAGKKEKVQNHHKIQKTEKIQKSQKAENVVQKDNKSSKVNGKKNKK